MVRRLVLLSNGIWYNQLRREDVSLQLLFAPRRLRDCVEREKIVKKPDGSWQTLWREHQNYRKLMDKGFCFVGHGAMVCILFRAQ